MAQPSLVAGPTLRGAPDRERTPAIYVSEGGNGRIDIYTKSIPNRLIGEITDGVCLPGALTTGPDGALFAVNDYGCIEYPGPSIAAYPHGKTTPSRTLTEGMYGPNLLAVSPVDGTLYASDFGANVIAYGKGKSPVRNIVYPLGARPAGVAVDATNTLYATYTDFASPYTAHVGKYDATTKSFVELGIKLMTGGPLAFDAAGNLVILDRGAGMVEVFAPGATTPIYTFGNLGQPVAMALDSSENVLYVADITNHQIDEISYPDGTVLGAITGFQVNTYGVAVTAPAGAMRKGG